MWKSVLRATFPVAAGILATTASPILHAQESEISTVEQASTMSETDILNSRLEDVVMVLGGQKAPEMVFAPSFLQAVPPAQLASLSTQLKQQFGDLEGVESVTQTGPHAADISLRFANAIGRGTMQLSPDGNHLVIGLLINNFEVRNDSANAIISDLESLPGEVSILYTPLDGWVDPAIALNPDRQMAIGSTFKLYVLSALAHQVADGRIGWDQPVRLSHKSLPSGMMQDWPAHMPVTVATLATMMISISDNTATDQLIDLVGRDAVEQEVIASGHAEPDRTIPFLSTLELFALKGDDALGTAYGAAPEEEQRALLAGLAERIAGDPANITPPTFAQPHAIDTLEWFASAQDIRAILERIKALDEPIARKIMAVNTSVPPPMRKKWAYIGFKGGSEPGVLNLSWLLQDITGEWHVLVMSWNNPDADVDKQKFELLALRILELK